MSEMLRVWLAKALDFILPRSETLKRLEAIDVEELFSLAKKAEEIRVIDCYAVFSYKNPLIREAIHEVKYHGNTRIANLLGKALKIEIESLIEEIIHYENFTDPIIVPVPTSNSRRKTKGFNQASLIANPIIETDDNPFNLKIDEDLLVKTKDLPSQVSTKNREERIKNLRGCFATGRGKSLKNKNIIVIDDVITTGATATEAQKTLLDAGARRVIVFAVAH